tara:strand:+ start:4227 stop:4616 length:390 start_codon:yes stop_codon:yes gene_type:complete
MCFVINKEYAEEFKMKSMTNDFINVGEQKNSSADIADHVAVHESGVKSVVKTGQGSALVVTAKAPQALGDNEMNARANLVEIVGSSVDKVLKEHKVKNKDKRIEIAMDVCDEILRFLDNPKNFKKNDEQ